MKQLHKEFPQYNWKQNKGYGTEQHRTAIEAHGLCKYHRKSFNILPRQFELFDDENLPVEGLDEASLISGDAATGELH
jgi:ribonuclease HII